MKRKIDEYLTAWREDRDRKVLLVRGARQVGKTYSIRHLGKRFDYFLEVNLEAEKPVHTFFEGSLDPHTINEKLTAYFGMRIIPEKTLLFFDEIQTCPNALRALRFYHERLPTLHVVAAGSLLEFALSEIPSFGVGRLSSLFMFPMTFAEFLWATGNEALQTLYLKASERNPLDPSLHEQLLEKFKRYMTLGGMPAVDYVLQKKERILPIEVKAGTKGQMQSLHLFLEERTLPLGIRLSHENFGAVGKISILPLYATEKLIVT